MRNKTSTKRTVLITGGTGSVGAALVGVFSSAGYDVAFTYASNKSIAKKLADRFACKALQLNLARRTNLPTIPVDVLINNAAINVADAETHALADSHWDTTLRVNLTAVFWLCKKYLPYMTRKGWGRVINISSIYGLRGVEGRLAYTVSKHGLSGLTKTVAKEYGRSGITCNEICPGPIDSRMMHRIARRESNSPAKYLSEISESIPMRRMATPDDVATLAIFLASEGASYVNGISIPLDGGIIA